MAPVIYRVLIRGFQRWDKSLFSAGHLKNAFQSEAGKLSSADMSCNVQLSSSVIALWYMSNIWRLPPLLCSRPRGGQLREKTSAFLGQDFGTTLVGD